MLAIVNGPSKLDLLTSLAYCYNEQRHLVSFAFNENVKKASYNRRVNIISMSAEDGSGESWSLQGYVQNSNGGFGKLVSIYYRTDSRTGFINENKI